MFIGKTYERVKTMRTEQFHYLIEVARCGSITVAAKKLHISQPTLSQALNILEEELGVKLLDRSRQGTVTTPVGEKIVNKAKEILDKLEELIEVANTQASSLTGSLSVAIIPSIALALLPKALVDFKNKYPQVRLILREEGSFRVQELVKEGEADLGIIAIPSNFEPQLKKNFLIFERLFVGEILACVGKTSPLRSRNSISFKEIINYPIVIYNQEYSMYKFITELLNNFGSPNVLFTSDNTEVTKRIVSEGLAIGFLTNLALMSDPYVQNGEVIPLHINDYFFNISFGWIRSEQHFPLAAKEFIKSLAESKSQL